ncbi:MAG: hypothetical protein ACI9EX_000691 [Oleispira sp.]|jgi:hypothetical protein
MVGNDIFRAFVFSITLLISISVQAEEKINAYNCYERSVSDLYEDQEDFIKLLKLKLIRLDYNLYMSNE